MAEKVAIQATTKESKEEKSIEDSVEKNANGKKDEGETTVKSLGEIAVIDKEISDAKTESLQQLHNLFYGKNGSGPQIKRNIRKFAGFEKGDEEKKLKQLLEGDLNTIKQTAKILAIEIEENQTKEVIGQGIIDFLMSPTGKTFEESQENEDEPEEEDSPVPAKEKKGKRDDSGARPKRATTARVWTNDFGSSEDEEENEEERPRVGRKKRADNSDSGSDYNPSGGSDSEADRRKSARNTSSRSTRTQNRRKQSESEEESEESEDFSDEEEARPAPKKSKNRSVPKRKAVQRGRKRKQVSDSEEDEAESEEDEFDSDDSEKQPKSKKTVTPQKNVKGRAKRAAAQKKARHDSDEEPEGEESEDDEPLKKPLKKNSSESSGPTDDDIKKLLKDILAEANLEEITMKTVCKKVYAHYPDHDLSQRKDFIKQTVKALIAA